MTTSDKVHVLIVDDNPDVCASLAEWLRLGGYVVAVAGNGEDALRSAALARPHCVLLDIAMPGMDGLELTKRLRKTYGDDIVLIAITGAPPSDPLVTQTFELIDHYFSKPIDPRALSRLLPAV